MATFAECIAAFESRRPVELAAVLTPRGEVVATIERLADLFSTLDDADREYVRPMLDEFVTECNGTACAALATQEI
jgi:hypothetical protein